MIRALVLSLVLSLALALALAGCAQHAASQGPAHVDIPVRDTSPRATHAASANPSDPGRPGPLPARDLTMPQASRGRLANGLELRTLTRRALPVVHVRLYIPAGINAGLLTGTGAITAQLLLEGTTTKTAPKLREQLASMGASLTADVDLEGTTLSLDVPTDKLDAALAMLDDLVENPVLDDADLRRVKDRLGEQSRARARGDTTFRATRELFHELFGDASPYASFELSARDAGRASLVAVRNFHRRFYVPEGATLVVCGDADAPAALAAAERAFGHWRGSRLASEAPKNSAQKPLAAPQVIVIHRPGATTADVLVGLLVPSRNHPEYAAARVAAVALGAMPKSRLEAALVPSETASRVRAAMHDLTRDEEPLVLYAATTTAHAVASIDAVLGSLAAPFTDDETARAAAFARDAFVGRLDGLARLADLVTTEAARGLPPGALAAYPSSLAKVEASEATAALSRAASGRRVIVVSGDGEALGPALRKYGAVRVVSSLREGEVVRVLGPAR